MPDLKVSITEIVRLIPTTGSLPVVVMADDLEEYVCKYDSGSKLINEYVSYRFLEIWGLPLLPAAFLTVKPEHVRKDLLQPRLQLHHFVKPCFALQFEHNALDINNLLLGLKGNYGGALKIRKPLRPFENRAF